FRRIPEPAAARSSSLGGRLRWGLAAAIPYCPLVPEPVEVVLRIIPGVAQIFDVHAAAVGTTRAHSICVRPPRPLARHQRRRRVAMMVPLCQGARSRKCENSNNDKNAFGHRSAPR